MFEEGAKVICSSTELYNVYGDKAVMLEVGMRLTVSGTVRVGGIRFLRFKETDEGANPPTFMSTAFTPLRSLN